MRLGILGTADIAFRRFLPSLKKYPQVEYAGVASRTKGAAKRFVEMFGGRAYDSYDALLADESIDAVYVPLPPALHYEWGKKVLLSRKHLLMEKPFTTSAAKTTGLLAIAVENGLAVHENYMFLYHSQLAKIKELIADGAIGDIRLYRMAFGFPKRAGGDFRYDKALGGGALLDCGGYPVRLSLELLGDTARVVQAKLTQPKGYEVDVFGSAVLENEDGLCAQVSFGMDNAYQCQLEVWGSKATLIAPRIFTAGDSVQPGLILRTSNGETVKQMECDDQFLHSIQQFVKSCTDLRERALSMELIRKQSVLVQDVFEKGEIR